MDRPMMIAMSLSVLAAAPAFAQAPAPATYVAKAGASDLYERTSSQMVLQSTKDAKIRDFATMMLRDHAKSTADVKRAATASRVAVPAPKLEPAQAQMVAELRRATGAQRDRLYVTQQRTAHQQALALHSGYARNGTAAPLKTVAAATAPVVQHHIEMLQGM
ncbi:MAG: DUF4142 domain-containing protein [Sphingomonas paucimobilis]